MLKVIKRTFHKTTQMTRMIIRSPLRRHVKSRFPHMNVTRIDDAVSVDPLFANYKSMYHGHTMAQVFFGTMSHTILVYGMKSKGEFPKIYQDYVSDHGATSALRRDIAQEEQSEVVQEIDKDYKIKDQFTEPYYILSRIQWSQIQSDI